MSPAPAPSESPSSRALAASPRSGCWRARDLEAEQRLDRELAQRPRFWRMVFFWLYEYNRY